MSPRRPLVAANWKLNGSRAANAALLRALCGALPPPLPADVVICPPFVYLADVATMLHGTGMATGGQDVATEDQGAFTGEVSAPMLRDVGCEYVIVGHSERRAHYGDSDEIVAIKAAAAARAGLVPIICVGETLAERDRGETIAVVTRQMDAVIRNTGINVFGASLVAYEPVWAIGTGRTATPQQAQEVHAAIRALIARHDATMAAGLRILYGGSVKAGNAKDLFAMKDIDGGLIGGASLDAAEFANICKAAVTDPA